MTDRLLAWPYHPQAMLILSFICTFYLAGTHGSLVALILGAALLTPFIAIALFIPYVLLMLAIAVLLSCGQFFGHLFA